jgi:integrase
VGVAYQGHRRLCDLSVVDPQKRKLLAKSHMSAINNLHHAALRSEAPIPVLTVGAFWDKIYRPWVEKNKRPQPFVVMNTCGGYTSKRNLHTAPSTPTTPLMQAVPHQTHREVEGKSLSHIRALMSGIFAHAVSTKGSDGKALIDSNPIRDVKVVANVRESKERVAYTSEETIAILNAIERTDAKLFFALCSVLGMRPSEAAATKSENIGNGAFEGA